MQTRGKALGWAITLAILVAAAGCGTTAVVDAEDARLQQREGLLYLEQAPFSGVVERRYPGGQLAARSPYRDGLQEGEYRAWWHDGTPRVAATFVDGEYDGIYRSWYDNGRPFEQLFYDHGREDGLQRSWTRVGDLFANYVVRDGRRYGLISSQLCFTLADEEGAGAVSPAVGATSAAAVDMARTLVATGHEVEALPYYGDADLTPLWLARDEALAGAVPAIGDFTLTNQLGETVTRADLAGRIHVASFVYTRCDGICPPVVGNLLKVQEALRGADDALMVSFSISPNDDTVDVLRDFGTMRGIEPATWQLLTGPTAAIWELARDSYFADSAADFTDDPDSFVHSETVLLVDADGFIRGAYNGTQAFEMERLIADLETLRHQPDEWGGPGPRSQPGEGR